MVQYPTRCQIIDVTGHEVFPGIMGKTPDVSREHVGKFGTAEMTGECYVKITLDDGNVLYGYECWWRPVPSNNAVHLTPAAAGRESDR